MNLTYFKFLFINTIKRKPIWITWFLFLFTCTCFLIILPLAATTNTLQVWSNTTMSICQTFMGMVAGLFTAVLSINIFKDTNEEGTELIVISKPISRFNIVLSKFILFGVYCLMINVVTVLLTCFTAFLPRTEPEFYGGLLLSMFIGNMVTFGIFGSISILLSLKFAKVGIIITNVIISLVFLIYQALTLFVFPTPLNELSNQKMSASTYILHNRNTETGEYNENEVAYFSPSAADVGKLHPCQATNWQEMKDYWTNSIVAVDPTPVINLTDLASQISLSYLSFGVNKFAERQAKRMFSMTRYYDYELTTPASPELVDPQLPADRVTIPWSYSRFQKYEIKIKYDEQTYTFTLYMPSYIHFDGVPPLTATKLRGYTNLIPVGYVRSKELFSSREIFLEKEDWLHFAPAFEAMYKAVYDYRNYPADKRPSDYSDYASMFHNQDCQKNYYDAVWACFTGHTDNPQYINPTVRAESGIGDYDRTYFRINNVNDLNDRFIQFKNYVYWKAHKEQQDMFLGTRTVDEEETTARTNTYALYPEMLQYALGITVQSTGNWFMKAREGVDDGIIDAQSQTPFIDYIAKTWQQEQQDIRGKTPEQQIALGLNSSWSIYKKTGQIIFITCCRAEDYLYSDLNNPTRQSKNTGEAYIADANWLPNIHGAILGGLIPPEEMLPLGQNMQWFNYSVTPRIQYWVFALVWGSIAVGLFVTGIVLYNKFDVK